MSRLNPFLDFIYRRGFRLSTLSTASGIPIGTLGSISAGNQTISLENRERLAEVLGCRPRSIPEPATMKEPKE